MHAKILLKVKRVFIVVETPESYYRMTKKLHCSCFHQFFVPILHEVISDSGGAVIIVKPPEVFIGERSFVSSKDHSDKHNK